MLIEPVSLCAKDLLKTQKNFRKGLGELKLDKIEYFESAKIKTERSEAKTWRKNEMIIAQVSIARHIAFKMEFTNFGLLSQSGINLTTAV